MSISLTKPSAEDIYDISVFNDNSTKIEAAVNKNETDITTITNELVNKLGMIKVVDTNFNLDSLLDIANYYIQVKPKGTLPSGTSGKGILMVYKDSNDICTQVLITPKENSVTYGIYIRTVSSATSFTAWQNLTSNTTVIDNLTTESSVDALSAKQGKILNENKLNISKPVNIADMDTISSGVYICNGTTVGACSSTFPNNISIQLNSTATNFVLECFTDGNTTAYQNIYDCLTDNSVYRYKKQSETDNTVWIWGPWLNNGSNSGGGGSGSVDESFPLIEVSNIVNLDDIAPGIYVGNSATIAACSSTLPSYVDTKLDVDSKFIVESLSVKEPNGLADIAHQILYDTNTSNAIHRYCNTTVVDGVVSSEWGPWLPFKTKENITLNTSSSTTVDITGWKQILAEVTVRPLGGTDYTFYLNIPISRVATGIHYLAETTVKSLTETYEFILKYEILKGDGTVSFKLDSVYKCYLYTTTTSTVSTVVSVTEPYRDTSISIQSVYVYGII